MSGGSRAPASLAGLAPSRRAGGPAQDKGGDITERITAVPPPALPPATPPAVSRAHEPPPRAEEIVVYWERLRRGRPFPPLADLDRVLVGKSWSDSLLVAFAEGEAMPRISRLGATNGAVEYTPMVTDWILTRARQSAQRGVKLDEVQSFPIDGETPRYRLLLMPFGMGEGASDGVLCHLCRCP